MRDALPSLTCRGFVNQSGSEIGVDRHLLAGHGIERESCGNFGHASGAFRDDNEVDRQQDQEDDDADDVVAAQDERAERLDNAAGVSFTENQPRRTDIESEAEECEDEEHGRERRELERIFR